MTGVVKWFDPNKRYGFILAHDKGPDIFVHEDDIEAGAQLSHGMEVEIDVHPTFRHPTLGTRRALTVRLLGKVAYIPLHNEKRKAAYGAD
jgi:cold shock CspA family protein